MHNFARLPEGERKDTFIATGYKMRLSPAIVEKDFWVCWMLDYLFSHCEYKDSFAFKGGTSLSKGFGLIDRFSEDIDLIFDWRLLGYGIDEPWEQRTNTKQDAFIEKINAEAGDFLAKTFRPLLEKAFVELLNDGFDLHIKNDDQQTLCFNYPRSFEESFILQEIRLETGALAAWTPTQITGISSYVAEQLPGSFDVSFSPVRVVSPERTFWEKATILHKEAFRTNERMPDRYSRHYYDIYRLCYSEVKDRAFANLNLLDHVVEFKMRFWRSNTARYDLCKPGTIKLMPPECQFERLKSDYARMQSMFFGAAPTFEQIRSSIIALEEEINSL
ncbi:MAG: nucleotidyl transferase AbiEii/AbiGii toxin family protein [Actinobacteria bacterium]|nr:nucleotidyl transferase AbiEii/AbiGii toxin family protein [Actinomycetota bacterium]